jgi:hypothetical protein
MQIVRRPPENASREEKRAYWERMAQACDAEGIGYGEDIAVFKAEAVDFSGDAMARSTDPDTAKDAAVNPHLRFDSARAQTLLALSGQRLTGTELARQMGKLRDSVLPRLNELAEGGTKHVKYDPPLAYRTTERHVGDAGVGNIVWACTPEGETQAEILRRNGAPKQ